MRYSLHKPSNWIWVKRMSGYLAGLPQGPAAIMEMANLGKPSSLWEKRPQQAEEDRGKAAALRAVGQGAPNPGRELRIQGEHSFPWLWPPWEKGGGLCLLGLCPHTWGFPTAGLQHEQPAGPQAGGGDGAQPRSGGGVPLTTSGDCSLASRLGLCFPALEERVSYSLLRIQVKTA